MATLIVNGTVVDATRVLQSDILIENETIVAIGENLDRKGRKILDAADCYVMPGGIDVHTHLNLQVGDEKVSDGFYHGSVAAAHGGTTTIVEHPGFGPQGCGLHHQTDLYRKQAADEMVIDYGMHSVIQHVDTQTASAIKTLTAEGIPSHKVYLTYGGRLEDHEIIQVMKTTHAAGGLTCFHAESHAIITELSSAFKEQEDVLNPFNHPKSRPDYSEAEAVNRIIALSRAAGNAPVYIVHLSTASGLEIIRKAKQNGLQVYSETCPQYLTLTEDCYKEAKNIGLQYIMSPPLRSRHDCDALWNGLADGTIDVLATDHCSFSFAQKLAKGTSNIFHAPGGIPGVETRVPLLFSEGVVKKRIDIKRFVQLISTNPAHIMGLSPQKGNLAIGTDADLMIIDPSIAKTIQAESLHQHVDYSPFSEMTVIGWPTTVMLRGKILVQNGKFQGSKGYGKYIKRQIQPQQELH